MYNDSISGNSIVTVFFGGGTPSLFSPKSIGKILDKINKNTKLENTAEITLEVNPRTADYKKLCQFKAAGINRISVGVQSFLSWKLDFLKRFCEPEDCIRTLNDIEKAGFDNYNMDIMYGAGGETLKDLEFDLGSALKFTNKHLSVYCLTIEPNTEFSTLRKKGLLELPDDERLSDMYILVSNFLEDNGFLHYETSNFARDGYRCRHNLAYWRSENYISFGAGAHSHLMRTDGSEWGERWSNFKSPKHYINKVLSGELPVDVRYEMGREESLNDTLMMGLRLSDGVDLDMLSSRYGTKIDLDSGKKSYLLDDGFINIEQNRLKLTRKGFLFSDRLIVEIINNIG